MRVAGVAAALVPGSVALAQADPTATQTFRLSAFGGMTGTFTDVLNGHNLGITAGADLTFRRYFGLTPSVEGRGVFPVVSGTIADERWLAGGLKFEGRFGPLHPYGDVLVGRGSINYQHGGLVEGPYRYITTTSTVYSPGAGADLDLSHHWDLKGDLQYQFWSEYPPLPGVLTPIVVTGGVIYRFDFNRGYRIPKQTPVDQGSGPAR